VFLGLQLRRWLGVLFAPRAFLALLTPRGALVVAIFFVLFEGEDANDDIFESQTR
jgi:hypothetical protein